jgi:hypothetical protein
VRVLVAEAKARRVMTGRQWCARRACPQGAGRKFDRAVRDFAYGCVRQLLEPTVARATSPPPNANARPLRVSSSTPSPAACDVDGEIEERFSTRGWSQRPNRAAMCQGPSMSIIAP